MKKILTAVSLFFSASAFPQSSISYFSASQTALAGSNGASVSGWESILINPASTQPNSAFSTDITLFSAGGIITNNSISLDFYETYFTGAENSLGKIEPVFLTSEDKKTIIGKFDPSLDGLINVQLVSFAAAYHHFSYGTFGFLISHKASGNFHIPKDFAELAFSKLNAPGLTYDLSGMSQKAMLRSEFVFSYSQNAFNFLNRMGVSEIKWGANLKWEQGLSYIELDEKKDIISTDENAVISRDYTYSGRAAGNNYFRVKIDKNSGIANPGYMWHPAGSGMGFDFGLSAKFKNGIKSYISVNDIGWIDWKMNTVRFDDSGILTLESYNLDGDNRDETSYLDSLKNLVTPQKSTEGFTTYLPVAVNAGISIPLEKLLFIPKLYPGEITAHFSFHQGLNESPGNTLTPRGSAGLEWKLFNQLFLRSGVSLGGLESFNWGFGAGWKIELLQIDIGTANFHHIFSGKSATAFSVAANMRFFIPLANN